MHTNTISIIINPIKKDVIKYPSSFEDIGLNRNPINIEIIEKIINNNNVLKNIIIILKNILKLKQKLKILLISFFFF